MSEQDDGAAGEMGFEIVEDLINTTGWVLLDDDEDWYNENTNKQPPRRRQGGHALWLPSSNWSLELGERRRNWFRHRHLAGFDLGTAMADLAGLAMTWLKGGALEVILRRLAEFQERAQSLKRKVKGAMVYPVVVVTVAVGILTFIMIKIVPSFQKIFEDFDTELPADDHRC